MIECEIEIRSVTYCISCSFCYSRCMYYSEAVTLNSLIGNNTFVYDERKELFGKAEIIVPQLVEGTLDDVQLGDSIVFAEKIDEQLQTFTGLQYLVHLTWTNTYIMDNHNHALYCRYKELLAGSIKKWLPLIHIDQHSDMKEPVGRIDIEKEDNLHSIAQYTNEVCTIADFIQPALQREFVSECIQLRTEYSLLVSDASQEKYSRWYILDIDIDFWAPEMGIAEFDRTIYKTRELIAGASMVTIATSPCFMDQARAVEIVKLLVS